MQETIIATIVHGIVMIVFIVLGIMFLRGKGANLIAGYNTSSPAAKAKTDEVALCRFMGKAMFALASCWLILSLGSILEIKPLLWSGFALFFLVIVFVLIYCNTGNRFKKKP